MYGELRAKSLLRHNRLLLFYAPFLRLYSICFCYLYHYAFLLLYNSIFKLFCSFCKLTYLLQRLTDLDKSTKKPFLSELYVFDGMILYFSIFL